MAYTWDNNGNLINDGNATYLYDRANRMISTTVGGVTTQFGYNGDGARLRQIIAGVPTTYTQDLASPLPVVLQSKTGADATRYMYALGTRPLAQNGTAWEYLLPDALGSVRQIADANGNVTLAESYEPYGTVLTSTGTASSIFGYAGEQADTTGLIYLRARYMNPRLGIFLARDPWSGDAMRPGSMNGFGYVEGNPINQVDPGGRAICLPPNHWETDPETGELRCVGPNSEGQQPLPPIGGVLNPPMGGTGINVSSGVGQAAVISFLALACAAAIDDLIRPKPRVIVELGAGDYKNAIAMKVQNPGAIVIATNLVSEWDLGRRLVKGGVEPDPSSTSFFVDMYKGWVAAKVAGVIVGDTRPIENREVPPGIADFVYTIFPYPDTAILYGIAAASIAKNAPGTGVSITSGGSVSLPGFIEGFKALRPFAEFLPMEGAPFGLPYNFNGRTWEGGNLITAVYVQTSMFLP